MKTGIKNRQLTLEQQTNNNEQKTLTTDKQSKKNQTGHNRVRERESTEQQHIK